MPRCRRLGLEASAQSAPSHVKVTRCAFADSQNVTMATLGCLLHCGRRSRGAVYQALDDHYLPALVVRRCERAISRSGTLGDGTVAQVWSRGSPTAGALSCPVRGALMADVSKGRLRNRRTAWVMSKYITWSPSCRCPDAGAQMHTVEKSVLGGKHGRGLW